MPADDANLYAYTGNDPVNLTDPTGMVWPLVWCRGELATVCGHCLALLCTPYSNPSGPGWSLEPPDPRTFREPPEGVDRRSRQRTQKPTDCQKAFLKNELAKRGLPTDQIDQLKFVSGLDANAGFLTRRAFNGGANAVTQGSTVYIQPGLFREFANLHSARAFEEVVHTAQFAMEGGAAFYTRYAWLSFGGILSGSGGYSGNMFEAFAKGASVQINAAYGSRCPR